MCIDYLKKKKKRRRSAKRSTACSPEQSVSIQKVSNRKLKLENSKIQNDVEILEKEIVDFTHSVQ